MIPARSALLVSWSGPPPARLAAARALAADGRPDVGDEGDGRAWSWVPATDDGESTGSPHVLSLQLETRGLEGRVGPGAGDLLAVAADPSWRIQPPGGLVTLAEDGSATAHTDQIGFSHVYLASGRDWAAISTSARALAVLAADGLDLDTLRLQSLLGWPPGDGTLFSGVTKLGAAGSARVAGGRLEVGPRGRSLPESSYDGTLDAAVRAAAALVRRGVQQALDDHPDLLLQLTGGLDSRILLAAIPPERRRDVACLTLVVPGSPDAELAARLTAQFEMRHHVVTLGTVSDLDPGEAQVRALGAARRLDAGTDALAFAVLERVEGELGSVPRLSGLGGEVVRGFYYVPAPLRGFTRDQRVARLARWRLFPNEEVPDEVIHARLRSTRRDVAVDRLRGIFAGYPDEWNDATDRFYLGQRMQRWAGLLASATSADRVVVNPMLDPEFLALGTSLPSGWKANARFLSRILAELDPGLAEIPLDGRPAPRVYADPGWRSRLTFAGLIGRKVVGKVSQRVTSSGRAPAGGVTLGNLVVDAWRADPAALEPVRDLQVVDPAWLDGVLAGATAPASAVALVTNLVVAAEALAAGSAA